MNKILVGSRRFFQSFKDFISKDVDYVQLIENPKWFKTRCERISKSEDLFMWRKMSPDEFITITLCCSAITLGKFLVPEFNKEIGFTIEHLKQLQPLVDKLDDKHFYEKVIYNSYILNNDFYLTEEQLTQAYNEYKKYR